MRKYSGFLLVLIMSWAIPCTGQYKPEREHRIKKSQFPETALTFIEAHIRDVRRKRYYQETDSNSVSYRVKFKKDRLWYRAIFDKEDRLQAIDIFITETDVPDESLREMKAYLARSFNKYRIRSLTQQYVFSGGESPDVFLKNAFQNLLLPGIRYVILISGKQSDVSADYEICFDSQGNLIRQRLSLPPNFDRVLY
jgi:hypothetical protein